MLEISDCREHIYNNIKEQIRNATVNQIIFFNLKRNLNNDNLIQSGYLKIAVTTGDIVIKVKNIMPNNKTQKA